MKIKTSELTGAALDWAVAKCEGYEYNTDSGLLYKHKEPHFFKPYSTDWAQGGLIIERGGIMFYSLGESNIAAYFRSRGTSGVQGVGTTHLIAAMRCLVASKLGDTVDVPEELA